VSESGTTTPDLSSVLREAEALVERRRFAHARVVIGHGLRHFPENSDLLYLSAFIEYVEDQHDAAMKTVQQVLAQDPEHKGARRLCAHLHEEVKEFAQAEALWIGLLREYPEDADLYASYAELMLKTLNLDKAGRLAKEGLRHEPENAGCLYVAAVIDVIEGGGARGTRQDNLKTLLLEHPEHVRTAFALVIALNDRGQHRDALRIAQELLRSQPDSQQYVALVRELKMQSHWTMMPLYPMQRWGWGGAAAVSIAGIVGVRALSNVVPEPVALTIVYTWLIYCIYSWVWPSILRKLI
jgi:tetratricopeptide (TPR) repeat protein